MVVVEDNYESVDSRRQVTQKGLGIYIRKDLSATIDHGTPYPGDPVKDTNPLSKI